MPPTAGDELRDEDPGLRSHGYRVTHVATATDALREAAEVPPELAVIDIGLPDGNGIDVLAALGRVPGIPPLVAVVFINFDDLALMAPRSCAARRPTRSRLTPPRPAWPRSRDSWRPTNLFPGLTRGP